MFDKAFELIYSTVFSSFLSIVSANLENLYYYYFSHMFQFHKEKQK